MHAVRLSGPHHGPGNSGCCKVGAPAQGLRSQSAQPSWHKCDSRSLRAVQRRIWQAASGGPPHDQNRNSPDAGPDGLLFLGVPMTSIGYVPSSAWQSDISMRRRIRYEHDAPRTMYDKIWDDHVVARLDDGTLWLASHWAHAGLDIDSIAI